MSFANHKILPSLACNLDVQLLQAALPLLENGEVHAMEWSFDALHRLEEYPPWFAGLLDEFSRAGRLIGHGIYFSLFSAAWLPEQDTWLDQLASVCEKYQFDHLTEHFGFTTGRNFHQGAPLAVPYTEEFLSIGQDRLQRLAATCRCPVGLENLAFAWSPEEARNHGDFLNDLLTPVKGFLILDLHNLYCQLHNFALSVPDVLGWYPLHRVREIHISGGSWQGHPDAPDGRVRRDTHDTAVPEEVFSLLETAIPRCPNLKYVVLEQLGTALHSPEQQLKFQSDFRRMSRIIEQATPLPATEAPNNFAPPRTALTSAPIEFPKLAAGQAHLSDILETSSDVAEARRRLLSSELSQHGWPVDQWPDHMLDTALQIAQKWKDGFVAAHK